MTVTVEAFGPGADLLSPMGKDLAKVRGEKLIQWAKDTIELGDMADLDPLETLSILVSLQLNEIVRVAQGVGLKREALDEKLNYIWEHLPRRTQMANSKEESSVSSDSLH